ncbi:MAG TPA: phosphatidate cytidylyltransferase [Chloroflexi bacterium]|nr:phosphatidate cytidylyltransferase [Chloroflexota bacterium]
MLSPVWATLVTFAAALAWLRLMDFAAERGWLDSHLSRKLIHIGTGPIFLLCWLLFPEIPVSRWLAALVPLAITAQFALVGLGIIQDEAAVQAMSRTGDRGEILRGPLYYGVMFVLLTLLFWKEHPAGMVALLMMCGGDGLADVVGRRIPSPALPWSRRKTLAGSLSVWLGGWIASWAILEIYTAAGVFAPPAGGWALPLLAVGLVAALVESLPFRDVDNITMTLAALLAAWAWL